MTIKLSELKPMVPYRLLRGYRAFALFASEPAGNVNIIDRLNENDLFFVLSYTKNIVSSNNSERRIFYDVKVIVSNKSIIGEILVDIGVETDDEKGFPFEEVREDQNDV